MLRPASGSGPTLAVAVGLAALVVTLAHVAVRYVPHTWIQRDGRLVLTATRGDRKIRADVDGYVTHGIGSDMKVTINAAGEVTAEHRR